jgi:hypothetical protein
VLVLNNRPAGSRSTAACAAYTFFKVVLGRISVTCTPAARARDAGAVVIAKVMKAPLFGLPMCRVHTLVPFSTYSVYGHTMGKQSEAPCHARRRMRRGAWVSGYSSLLLV